jgi:hypothetical protein
LPFYHHHQQPIFSSVFTSYPQQQFLSMPSFNLKTSIVVLFAAHHLAIAAPAPTNSKQLNNAYSGSGGNASGGHVYASESDNDVRTSLLAGIVGKGGLRGLGLNVLSSAFKYMPSIPELTFST